MYSISEYPEFKPLAMEMRSELDEIFESLSDGVSEFTFASLYLHRNKYTYELSRNGDILIVRGHTAQRSFFFTLNGIPLKETLLKLFSDGYHWKLLSASFVRDYGEMLAQWGIKVNEDRDNFDYLYLRTELAELKGKTFHKKKNLVNAFNTAHQAEIKPLDESTAADALAVLEQWNEDRQGVTDYKPAKEALSLIAELRLTGWIVYVEGKPVGWSLGEKLGSSMFCVHFEKGLESIKGVYQFINTNTAQNLDDSIMYINREQDLGDVGLRQAKMTYRPCGFVTKYTAELE